MKKNWKTMDGNTAAAHVSYAFTEVAAIYPITPSSTMPEVIDEWAAHGRKNIFGKTVRVTELQSEAGAAGAVHGALSAGSLATTFTASQGLLLMLPNMYKIAGELLPGVFDVTARAIAGHALSIFGDQSDVMACRGSGFAFLASGSVQEVMDLTAVSHLTAIKGSIPFLNFFDGFRTSHEIQKIDTLEYEDLARLVDYDALARFKALALNPEHPYQKGTAQNPDIFFQAKEASNRFYTVIPDMVESYMQEIRKLTGREYHPFNYYGAPDAENVIVAMGSVCQAIEETVDYLNARGEKTGVVEVHLYRPFSEKYFFGVLPSSVKRMAVLDRCKEAGALGEPLYQDVCTLFRDKAVKPLIVGGRYGLGSKDTTPTHIKAVFDNLKLYQPRDHFTISINDDVTGTSLPAGEPIAAAPEGTIRCKFWGLGSDGTVGANKNSIKIIGDETDLYAQGYFSYDSKKSGGITVSHLRFGKKPIKSTYLIDNADFIACHKQEYVHLYDVLAGLKKGGTFLLNTQWTKMEDLEKNLPSRVKRYLADKGISFYVLNGTDIAEEIGLGNRTNMIMQAAFFKLSGVIPLDDAVKYMKDAIDHTYGKKGEKVLQMNYRAVDAGINSLIKIEVPASWTGATSEPQLVCGLPEEIPDFIRDVCMPINAQEGDSLPVSAFIGREDGRFPSGTSAYEKRGVAVNVPEWKSEKCIQCNQCAMVCPHATIRPVVLDKEEAAGAPEGFGAVDIKGKEFPGCKFKIQVDPLDCMGCGNCADICPVGALEMKPLASQEKEICNWNFALTVSDKSASTNKFSVKGSQFSQPLLEFSGACAGCGETPYVKLLSALFGDRALVANATGCSSIYGGNLPTTPWAVNADGRGPAWANSLFEDNAEFGMGMRLAVDKQNEFARELLAKLGGTVGDDLVKGILEADQSTEEGIALQRDRVATLKTKLAGSTVTEAKLLLPVADVLVKRSVWIVGGDGWAYDIGYGGLDHVLASGRDVNVLVLDTEVYSNTGGQMSKSTPMGAVAKFAAGGKQAFKKDLAMMAMSYGSVYVARVAFGANDNHVVKAFREAESYKGTSLILAYSHCIAHGFDLKTGMSQQKKAVESGHWPLLRYDPRLSEAGKNPLQLDSKDPTLPLKDYVYGETRYAMLHRAHPAESEALIEASQKNLLSRWKLYKHIASMPATEA